MGADVESNTTLLTHWYLEWAVELKTGGWAGGVKMSECVSCKLDWSVCVETACSEDGCLC